MTKKNNQGGCQITIFFKRIQTQICSNLEDYLALNLTLVTKADCICATVTASFTCLPQLQLEMVWSCCRPATEGNEGWGELGQWLWQWHFSIVYSRLGCKVFSSKIWTDTYQSILKQSTILGAFKRYLVECPFLTTNSTMNYHSDAWLPASC